VSPPLRAEDVNSEENVRGANKMSETLPRV
jgi:hypothetical protein